MIPATDTHIPVATTLPRDAEATVNLLAMVGVDVPLADVLAWSQFKIDKAEDWAGSVLLHQSAGTAPIPKPAFLNHYVTSDGEVRT